MAPRGGEVIARVVPHQGRPLAVLDTLLAGAELADAEYFAVSGHLGHVSEAAAIQRALGELPGALDAVIPGGTVSRQVAVTMDWTATVLAATGTALDARYPLDGEDVLAELRGPRRPRPRTLHWRHRRGDAPVIQEAMLEGRLKYVLLDERESLFDLDADEHEVADLAAARPADVARMRRAHDAWFAGMRRL